MCIYNIYIYMQYIYIYIYIYIYQCISLSTNAVWGRVKAAVPVVTAPLVGSFGGSSTIQWHGAEKTLAVAMTATMPLSGGDVITLRLPQFTLPRNTTSSAVDATASAVNTTSSAVLELQGRSANIFVAAWLLGGAGAGGEDEEGRGVWNEELNVLELRVRSVVGQVTVKEAESVAIRVSFFYLVFEFFFCVTVKVAQSVAVRVRFVYWCMGVGREGGREGWGAVRVSESERVNSCACVCV